MAFEQRSEEVRAKMYMYIGNSLKLRLSLSLLSPTPTTGHLLVSRDIFAFHSLGEEGICYWYLVGKG